MIWPVVLLFIVHLFNTASAGVLGTRAEDDWEHGRLLYVTALDGTKHIIDKTTRPVPQDVKPLDVTFHLYTRNDENGSDFNMDDFQGNLDGTGFDPTLPTYFFIHGWTINHLYHLSVPKFILDTANGIDANVFLVDYQRVAKFFYTFAVGSLPEVGQIVADGIESIVVRYGMDFSQISLAGHSLGGQMCGFVGARLGGQVSQIISLDPAGPLFEGKDPSVRLDPTDAKHVQVIHTNGGLLGYKGSLGHADYFPNSGRMNQPNCDADLLGICAHIRALHYFYESLHSDRFVATKCDTWEDYLAGSCDENHKSSMGMIVSDKEATGNYYLKTTGESLFALG